MIQALELLQEGLEVDIWRNGLCYDLRCCKMLVVSIGVVYALVMVIYFCERNLENYGGRQADGQEPRSLTNSGSLEVWHTEVSYTAHVHCPR